MELTEAHFREKRVLLFPVAPPSAAAKGLPTLGPPMANQGSGAGRASTIGLGGLSASNHAGSLSAHGSVDGNEPAKGAKVNRLATLQASNIAAHFLPPAYVRSHALYTCLRRAP
jgi:hypothetical protein